MNGIIAFKTIGFIQFGTLCQNDKIGWRSHYNFEFGNLGKNHNINVVTQIKE